MRDSQVRASIDRHDPSGRESSGASRRSPYRTPNLISYGSVAALTQGNLTTNADAGPLFLIKQA